MSDGGVRKWRRKTKKDSEQKRDKIAGVSEKEKSSWEASLKEETTHIETEKRGGYESALW